MNAIHVCCSQTITDHIRSVVYLVYAQNVHMCSLFDCSIVRA